LFLFLFVVTLWEAISLRLDMSDESSDEPSKHVGRCPEGQVTYVAAGNPICLPAEVAGRLRGYEQGVNDTLCLVRDGQIPCETKWKVGP
jgi:hypothetical protein